VTTLVCYQHTAHEAAGATGTRHSPRPHLGERVMHDSGASRRGIAEAYLKLAHLRLSWLFEIARSDLSAVAQRAKAEAT
jgi:hypothetical protein